MSNLWNINGVPSELLSEEDEKKLQAKKLAKCRNLIKIQKNPNIKAQMEARLELGIYDFSDLLPNKWF